MTLTPSFAFAIAAMCAQYEGTRYHEACLKAVDAGTRQVGLRQGVDDVQNKVNQLVTQKARSTFGETTLKVVATGTVVVKTVNEKRFSFGLPTLGLANSINNEVGVQSYKIEFKWNW